jgi:hypothetical protein
LFQVALLEASMSRVQRKFRTTTSAWWTKQKKARPRVELLEDRTLMTVMTAQPLLTLITPNASSIPGFSPSQLQTAYGFNNISFLNGNYNNAGSNQTIAIVDAYNAPNIQSDLTTFDTQYGLPTANLTVVNQTGGSNLPATNASWAQEISLDVEWAHAMAPAANIVLVEANSATLSDLFAAVSYASTQASVVSMSWGSGEFSTESSYSHYFTTSGVTFVASSGDVGGKTSYPAVDPNVLAVGGTTLTLDSSNGISSESAWSSGGGGSSTKLSRPSYQTNYFNSGGLKSLTTTQLNNGKRLSPDVAYDANPSSGISVYDSTPYLGLSGWLEFGGTSVGAPQWAALVSIVDQNRVLNGQTSLSTSGLMKALYSPSTYSSNFHDITTGKAGINKAGTGYDLATGLGSPNAANIVANLASVSSNIVLGGGGSGTGTGGGSAGAHVVQAPTRGQATSTDGTGAVAAMPPASLPAATTLVGSGEVLPGAVATAAGLVNTPPVNVAGPLMPNPSATSLGSTNLLTTVVGSAGYGAPTAVTDREAITTTDTPTAEASNNGAPTGSENTTPNLDAPAPILDNGWSQALDLHFADQAPMPGDPFEQGAVRVPALRSDPGAGPNHSILTASLAIGVAGLWALPKDQDLQRQRRRARM